MGWDGMGRVRMVWCGVVWYGSWLDGWGVLDECVNTTSRLYVCNDFLGKLFLGVG